MCMDCEENIHLADHSVTCLDSGLTYRFQVQDGNVFIQHFYHGNNEDTHRMIIPVHLWQKIEQKLLKCYRDAEFELAVET